LFAVVFIDHTGEKKPNKKNKTKNFLFRSEREGERPQKYI